MKWDITTQPTAQIVDYSAVARMVKPAGKADETYLLELLEECTKYAEEKMECSLRQQTITATYWVEDSRDYNNGHPILSTIDYTLWPRRRRVPLSLPRGPVQSITSVKDANGNDIAYTLERMGNADEVHLTPVAIVYPVTVVYVAGYSDVSQIPADIRGTIKTHVATRYRMPEAMTVGTVSTVTNLDEFYRARGRGKQVY